MTLVIVIDTRTFLKKKFVVKEEYTLQENEKFVYDWKKANTMLKPKWNGSTWIESATEEEIKAWQEEYKTQEDKQPSEEQKLLSTVIKEQLKEQQELSSNLMLQIAQLKGGNTNV